MEDLFPSPISSIYLNGSPHSESETEYYDVERNQETNIPLSECVLCVLLVFEKDPNKRMLLQQINVTIWQIFPGTSFLIL